MKIFDLLSCLSKQELKLLRKAVQSPVFNTNRQVVKLFDLLRKQHPHFDHSLATKRKLFKKLFPQQGFSEPKLLQLLSYLTNVVEQFLLHFDQIDKPIEQQQRLASIYSERGLTKLYHQEIEATNRHLNRDTKQSVITYQRKFELGYLQYFHPAYKKNIIGDELLNQTHEQLDIYYAIQKLRLVIASKSRVQVMREDPLYHFVSHIKEAWSNGFQKDNILLKLYLQALAFYENSLDFEFSAFEDHLFQQLSQFDLADQQFLYTSGLNYTIKQKNKKVDGFDKLVFRWLRFGLANKLLISNKIMNDAVFSNIVVCACQEKAFDWAHQFIVDYHIYLPKENRTGAALYYQSYIFYAQGDWDKTLDVFSKNDYKEDYQPRIRVLIIRALFEKFLIDKDYWELLMSKLQSFDNYLRRNHYFPAERLAAYQNFVKLSKQLAKRIYAREKTARIKKWFEEKIFSYQPLIAKNWLCDKVEAL